MKINLIELYHVSVPLKDTFWPTWIPGYPQTHNRFTLIKLVTDEGIEGYSAGSAMGREREGLGDLLGGYLMGADPTDIDRVQSLLKQAGYLGWRNFWIEPACWDIIGKDEGQAGVRAAGRTARRPSRSTAPPGEMHEPERRVDELLAMRERGFKTAKLRVKNAELKDDIRHIEMVRKGAQGKDGPGRGREPGLAGLHRGPGPGLGPEAGEGVRRRLPRQQHRVARGAAGFARLRRQRRAEPRVKSEDLRRGAELRVGRDQDHAGEGLLRMCTSRTPPSPAASPR